MFLVSLSLCFFFLHNKTAFFAFSRLKGTEQTHIYFVKWWQSHKRRYWISFSRPFYFSWVSTNEGANRKALVFFLQVCACSRSLKKWIWFFNFKFPNIFFLCYLQLDYFVVYPERNDSMQFFFLFPSAIWWHFHFIIKQILFFNGVRCPVVVYMHKHIQYLVANVEQRVM